MRLSIDEAVLVTLLQNTHLKHWERKLQVLLIAFGSECSRERKFQGTKVPGNESSWERKFQGAKVPENESSRERKYQGAKVPPMVLSLLGAKVRGNESSSYHLSQIWLT